MLARCRSWVSALTLGLVIVVGLASAQQDNYWKGGTGVWSDPTKWTRNKPQKTDNVWIFIYDKQKIANDVALDQDATIRSLTIKGNKAKNLYSTLSDSGVQRTLNIANALTVTPLGELDFTGNGSSIAAGTIAVQNEGVITIGEGVTLNLTNQPNGITQVNKGSAWTIAGDFSVAGVANTGFAKLSSVWGSLNFQNGQTQTISPPGKELSLKQNGPGGGSLDVSSVTVNGVVKPTTLIINANVTSNVYISMSNYGKGTQEDNAVTINGKLDNSGNVRLSGPGDVFTTNNTINRLSGNLALTNFLVENGSEAVVTNTLQNYGQIEIDGQSKFVVGQGQATGNAYFQFATGTLGEMIGPKFFGSIDLTKGGGGAVLDGPLDIQLQGFDPAPGKTYDFITCAPGALIGEFSNIQHDIFNNNTEKWMVNYDYAAGIVQLQALKIAKPRDPDGISQLEWGPNNLPTPEPSGFVLAGTGLLVLLYEIRRRRQG